MSVPTVRTEKDGAVWTIILDRPQARNAVDRPTAEALSAALRAFEADEHASVGVLYGAGGNFCAGADLKAIGEDPARRNRLEPHGDGPMGPSRMLLDKPVIAAIEGFAVAGGLELALWCDLRVAADNATLGVFCRRFGVPLIDGGTVRLPRLIGLSRALDLILTGRPVPASEAVQMGLVNRVAPKGTTLEVARGLALELSRFPQACLRADRRSAYESYGMPLEEALSREFTGGLPVVQQESVTGAQRFSSGAGRHGTFDK